MVKSIAVMGLLCVGIVVAAAAVPIEPAKTKPDGACAGGACAGGACAKATAKACGGCPAATASVEGASQTCTKDCQKDCGNCPAATATKETSAAGCAGGACATAACGEACGKDCKDCPITAAMKALPQMTFAVGDEKLCCPKAAAELAQKSNAAVRYVAGDKTFDAESEAQKALVESTEQYVAAFVEPQVCKESGKVAIAGKQLCCENVAAQVATVAKAAMEKVEMTYMVGEKECKCPNEAAQLAKDSGDPTVFMVAGEKTCCDVTAKLNLLRAKYKAAVVAVMQAEAQPTEKLTSQGS